MTKVFPNYEISHLQDTLDKIKALNIERDVERMNFKHLAKLVDENPQTMTQFIYQDDIFWINFVCAAEIPILSTVSTLSTRMSSALWKMRLNICFHWRPKSLA